MRMPRVQFAGRMGHTPSRGTLGIRVPAGGGGVQSFGLNGTELVLIGTDGSQFPVDLASLIQSQVNQILANFDYSTLSQTQIDALAQVLQGEQVVDVFNQPLGYLLPL